MPEDETGPYFADDSDRVGNRNIRLLRGVSVRDSEQIKKVYERPVKRIEQLTNK